jgi:transcriptional regulator with PAS, ATPase and Fis domain
LNGTEGKQGSNPCLHFRKGEKMKTKKNIEIRQALKEANICHWELAEKLGIAESTLCVKLRKELPPEEKEKILMIIDGIKKDGK